MRPPLIALLCVSAFASTFSTGAFPALLPELGTVAGLADWQLGTVAGAFGLARMLADVPIGLLITHHLRRALLAAPFLLVIGVMALGAGGPFPLLVLGRAVMGLAHALFVVGGLTAILRFQVGALGAALNAFELSAMLGILGGTVLLGLLPGHLSWNVALLVSCSPQVLALVALPPLLAALPNEPPVRARPLFARHAAATASSPVTFGVVLAFAAGGVIAITYSTLEQFVLPLRGSRELGLDRSGVARLLMIVQVCDIACLLPFGLLADRRGVSRVLGLVLLAFCAGTALIAFGDFTLLVLGCVMFGIGMAGWTLPLGLLRRETPAEQIGWRTAVYRVGVDGGIFLGPFLSGLLAGGLSGVLPALCAAALFVIAVLLLRRG